jgi:hypothetical protein
VAHNEACLGRLVASEDVQFSATCLDA